MGRKLSASMAILKRMPISVNANFGLQNVLPEQWLWFESLHLLSR
jgi:hypothetical protein